MSDRWHVLRSEFSPATGLRQVVMTRQPVRPSKAYDALVGAIDDTARHMDRGGLVQATYLTLTHHCSGGPYVCDEPWEHVIALWWAKDPTSRLTTLRLVPA